MRYLLSLGVALAGCSFYQPDLVDCALPCADGGVCPDGLTCTQGLCRPPGKTTPCECLVGASRPCGTNVGVCKQGFQECTTEGSWGACTGGIEPSPELCDGKDNDCDGYTDYQPSKLVVSDRAPYTTYSTRLLGFDGGFFVYHYSVQADGGDSFLVHRFDRGFAEQGEPALVWDQYTERSYVAEAPGGMVMAFAAGTDLPVEVRTASPSPDTPSVRLAQLTDTHYYRRIHVAAMPGAVRVGWGTSDEVVRLTDVPWDGGAPTVFELPRVTDGGTLTDFTLSSDGRYSIWQMGVDDGSGGTTYVDFLADNQSKTVLRTGLNQDGGVDYVFTRGRQPLLSRGPQLAYLSDWTDPTGVTRMTFTYDYLKDDETYEVLPPGAWAESDVVLTPSGGLLGVVSNPRQQSLVLMGVTGTSFYDVEVTLRNLPDNSGFGPPSLALCGGEMVGVTWTTSRGIMGRLVCPPRVGD